MRGKENSQSTLITSFWCVVQKQFVLNTKHQHTERTFQSFLCQSPWETLRSPLRPLLLKGLIRHGDLDFNKTGLQQNAALAMLPEPLFSPGMALPAQEREGASVLQQALPVPAVEQTPPGLCHTPTHTSLLPTSTHQDAPSGKPSCPLPKTKLRENS